MTQHSDAGRGKTLREPVAIGGDKLHSPVGIGLNDLPNIGGGPPAPPPVPASLQQRGATHTTLDLFDRYIALKNGCQKYAILDGFSGK